MAGKITGSANGLLARLQQVQGGAVAAINTQMEIEMRAVQQEAIHRVPVDHGNVEAAIKIVNGGLRRHWIVYVDDAMPDDTGRYTVGDYAMWLHESQYELGPKSEAKNSDGKVGRKYLSGPFDERRDEIISRLQAQLRAVLESRR